MSKKQDIKDGSEITVAPTMKISTEQLKILKDALPSEQLALLSPLLENILSSSSYKAQAPPPHQRPVKTMAATDLKSLDEAVRHLKIDHQPTAEYGLYLKDDGKGLPSLSPHYSAVISDLRTSGYIRIRTNESFSRTILDLILVDRLNNLEDKESSKRLHLSAEVPVLAKVTDDLGNLSIYTGRADWALGYGESKSETGSLLVVVEAKQVHKTAIGMPQMVVYMTAVHDARHERQNKTVWGMLSDGDTFYFACLTNERKLLNAPPLTMQHDQSKILKYIDTILSDAIQSSPHTTPVKLRNVNIVPYNKYLRRSWAFGVESDAEEEDNEEDEDLVDVVERNGRYILVDRTVRD